MDGSREMGFGGKERGRRRGFGDGLRDKSIGVG
jgi:hypothetical protein